MTRAELVAILEYVEGTWNRPVSDLTARVWWAELGALDAEVVGAAVRAIARAGREHPPHAGHVLGEIADQTESAPSFGEAWEQILAAIRRHGSRNEQRIVDALEHPAVAQLAAQLSIRELGMAPESALTTWHAQARERYRSIVAGRRRAITHHGLPSAAARPELRGGEGRAPQRVGGAVGELVASLRPADAEGDAA